MSILFLSNNPQVSDTLYNWLVSREERVIYQSEPINRAFVEDYAIHFIVSYNYQHIIQQDVLQMMPRQAVNLHISLLPYNRGFSPNIWSFIDKTPSGVTIHEMDAGIDTGDILLQQRVVFDPEKETLRSSYNKLHEMIQALFCENWGRIQTLRIEPKKQIGAGTVHTKADESFFAPIVDYDDTIIDFISKVNGINPA